MRDDLEKAKGIFLFVSAPWVGWASRLRPARPKNSEKNENVPFVHPHWSAGAQPGGFHIPNDPRYVGTYRFQRRDVVVVFNHYKPSPEWIVRYKSGNLFCRSHVG